MSEQDLYRNASTGAVYVELFNELHHITDPATLGGVFGGNPDITDDVPPYPITFEIGLGSFLLRQSNGRIYLMTNGTAYYITSPEALEHYQFNANTFPVDSGDNVMADFLIRICPAGPSISV